MRQYHELLERILDEGVRQDDRTGVGTLSVFGHQSRYRLEDGFPLVTTKKVFTRGIIEELLWFLRGSTDARELQAKKVRIWDEWAGEDGDLGPIYGKQWRGWGAADGSAIDQIAWVRDEIRRNPSSRRLIVNAWNVGELGRMALPPCHLLFQFSVAPGRDGGRGRLSCQLYQRSGDAFLGVPFNIASYALLTHMMAQVCDLDVGDFVHTLGDAHLYTNHLDQARLQLTREPRALPRLVLDPEVRDIDAFTIEDIAVEGYDPHPAIKGEVAV